MGCAKGCRVEWDAYDLRTTSGVRLEVKAAGYVQRWAQRGDSSPSFDIAAKRSWDAATNTYAGQPLRPADVYVFALHAHRERSTIDPLDVRQWEFFVLRTRVLDDRCANQKRIGLNRFKALGAGSVTFAALRAAIEAEARGCHSSPQAV